MIDYVGILRIVLKYLKTLKSVFINVFEDITEG